MKHRKLMAMLLSLVIALTFMPAIAFADEEAAEGKEPAPATELQGETAEQPEMLGAQGAASEEENEIEVQSSTKYLEVGGVRNEDPDNFSSNSVGWVYDHTDHTLKLEGVGSGEAISIEFRGFDLTIKVVGSNSVSKIDGGESDKLEIMGNGILSTSGLIRAKNVTISGGTVSLNTSESRGIYADNVTISGGTVNVNSSNSYGIYADTVTISGGTVNTNTEEEYGIHAATLVISDGTVNLNGDYNIGVNNVMISGGTVSLNGSTGIEAQSVTISGGKIISNLNDQGSNGIWATNVTIKGGDIDIRNVGDGIHAWNNVVISGGNVKTAAYYHGINANNGKILISGGNTRVVSSIIPPIDIGPEHFDGIAMLAGQGIEIYDPLNIIIPENSKVEKKRFYDEWDAYSVFKADETVADIVVIEPKSEANNILIATAKAKGKESIDLSWNKLDGVDGYDVFFSRCNTKKQKYTCEYAGSTDGSATAWSKADLKRRTPYKMYVMAYVMSGGSKTYVAKSPTVHAYTGGGNGRYTNPKSVKVKKSKVTVKKNKTYKIKASVRKLRKGKKLINGRHARKLRYLSSNTSVATVSRYGKIKGVAPGTCDVYVLAVNGSYKKVAVTVK